MTSTYEATLIEIDDERARNTDQCSVPGDPPNRSARRVAGILAADLLAHFKNIYWWSGEITMIRRARASDIVEAATLYHTVWHETQAAFMPRAEIVHRSVEFFIHRMTALFGSTLVTEKNETIVAFSAWRGSLLGQLFVAIGHRGTDIAPTLLTTTEIEMAKEGTAEAELHCVVGNERACRFYERMGWARQGKIMERVAGEHTQIEVPFWRMKKVLSI